MRAPTADTGGHHGGRVRCVAGAPRRKRHKGLLKHSTLLSYRGILEKYLRPAFGAIRSDRLTSQVVISWESRLAETLAPKTLNNVVTTMRGLLSWAREQQFLAHDPMATIKPARVPRDEQPCLQPSELNNLLDTAATLPTRDQAIVYLAAYSGLRRGELFGYSGGIWTRANIRSTSGGRCFEG